MNSLDAAVLHRRVVGGRGWDHTTRGVQASSMVIFYYKNARQREKQAVQGIRQLVQALTVSLGRRPCLTGVVGEN